VGVLVDPPPISTLLSRSALKLDTLDTLAIAWPESFSRRLTRCSLRLGARRVILSWDPHGLTDFIERHARRAEIVGDMPLDAVGKPLARSRRRATRLCRPVAGQSPCATCSSSAVGPAICVEGRRRGGAAEPPDAVVATTLPSREELRLLSAIAQPLVVALASQVAYLKSIASLSSFALPSRADRAQDRNAALRAEISARLTQGDVDGGAGRAGAIVRGARSGSWRERYCRSAVSHLRQPTLAGRVAAIGLGEGLRTVGTKDRASAKTLWRADQEVACRRADWKSIGETFLSSRCRPCCGSGVRRLRGRFEDGESPTA